MVNSCFFLYDFSFLASSSFFEERDLTIQWNFVDHTLTENPENNKKYLNISQLVSQAVFGLSTNQKSIYTKREYRWYGRSQKKCRYITSRPFFDNLKILILFGGGYFKN